MPIVIPRWSKQLGDLSFLEDNYLVPVQWIRTPKISQELGDSVYDLSDARRAERGSAEYRVAVERVAESILEKLS